jgi:DNA-binding protein HU-beta
MPDLLAARSHKTKYPPRGAIKKRTAYVIEGTVPMLGRMGSAYRRLDPHIQHNIARYTGQLGQKDQEFSYPANASPPAPGHFIIVPRLTVGNGLKTMNKKELVDAMAAKTHSSGAAANGAVNALVEIISESLKKGESLALPGFGTFEVRDRAARSGRNPQTGEELKIAASKVAAFKAGAALKAAVNGGGKQGLAA